MFYDHDDESCERVGKFFPERLDTPLMNTVLIAFARVLKIPHPKDRPLRGQDPYRPEREFLQDFEKRFVPKIATIKNAYARDRRRLFSPELYPEFGRRLQEATRIDLPSLRCTDRLLTGANAFLRRALKDTKIEPGELSPKMNAWLTVWCELFRFKARRREASQLGRLDGTHQVILGFSIVLSHDHCAIVDTRSKITWFGSSAMFLAIDDMLHARIMARLNLESNHDHRIADRADLMYKWQDEILDTCGNEAYNLTKATEPLLKTWLARMQNSHYFKPDSYDNMRDKMEKRACEMGMPGHVMKFAPTICRGLDMREIMELFGLNKAIGYPILDLHDGGRHSAKVGRDPDASSWREIDEAIWLYCHLILKNYIARTGSWPEMEFRAGSGQTKLKRLYDRQVLAIADGSYPLENWRFADILNIYRFDYHEDYLELMKDKSCAPPRSKAKQVYRGEEASLAEKKVLTALLKRPEINTRDLISAYANDTLPDDLFNIHIHPKEKEHKLGGGRGFGMLTYELRLALAIVQENTKSGPFQDLPYQSMTMSKNELTAEILKMTSVMAKKGTRQYQMIELDLSNWNLKFRDRWIGELGKRKDKMFGVRGVFGRVHQVFQKATFSMTSPREINPAYESREPGSISPEWYRRNENPMNWTDHDGGIEGLAQKDWTEATLCMVYKALWLKDTHFKLMGQGDNQTLVLWIDRPMRAYSRHCHFARIERDIDIQCQRLNHDAKPEEFIRSQRSFTYCKVVYCNGGIVPRIGKESYKMGPTIDSNVPSTLEAIGSIHSAAVGSADNSTQPLIQWHVANLLTELVIRLLKRTPWSSNRTESKLLSVLDDDALLLAMTIPSSLGGFPVSTISSYMCKHEPDPVTSGLAVLRRLSDWLPPLRRYLLTLDDQSTYAEKPNLRALAQDPYSLPFRTGRSGNAVLREAADTILRASTVNTAIRGVIRYAQQMDEPLSAAILGMRPLYPEIAHDLLEISHVGRAASIVKMFTNTSTIAGKALRAAEVEYKIRDAEVDRLKGVIFRLLRSRSKPPRAVPKYLAHEKAAELRKRWGVPIAGIGALHPLDCTLEESVEGGVVIYRDPRYHNVRDTEIGRRRMYLGGKTEERRTGEKYELEPVPGISHLKKLVLASTAADMSLDALSLFVAVAKSRTPIPLTELQRVMPTTIGGTIAHRYEMMGADGRIGPTGNVNLFSRLRFDTDHIPGISGSKEDFPIAFSQLFSWGASLSRMLDLKYPKTNLLLCLKLPPVEPLIDEQITAPPSARRLTELGYDYSNPLVHIPVLSLNVKKMFFRSTDYLLLKTEQFLKTTKKTVSLLASILEEHYGVPNRSSSLLDETDLYSPAMKCVLGAVEFDSVGSLKVWIASQVVAARLVARKLVLVEKRNRERKSFTGLTYRCCYIVAKELAAHNGRFGADMTWIRDKYELLRFTSRNEEKSRRVLAQAMSERVLADLFGKGRLTLYPVVPFAIGGATGPVRILQSSLALVTMWLESETGKMEGITRARDLYGSLRKSYNLFLKEGGSSLAALVDAQATVIEMIGHANDIRAFDLLFYLENVITQDLKIRALDTSPREAARLLRKQGKMRQTEATEISPKVTVLPDSPPVIPVEIKPSAWSAPAKDYTILGPSEPISADEVFYHHSHAGYGIFTHVAGFWVGLLREEFRLGPVHVIGTGAGGVQNALSSLGIASFGLDLRQSILGDGERVPHSPPECVISNHDSSAIYGIQVHSTTGDASDPNVLSAFLGETSAVVVDVELGATRVGLIGLSWLADAGFSQGKVIIKVLATVDEISEIIAVLHASRGVRFHKLYPLSLCVSCSVKAYAVVVTLGTDWSLATTIRSHVIIGSEVCHPRLLPTDTRAHVELLVNTHTGYLCPERTTVKGKYAYLRTYCENAANKSDRHSLPGGTLMEYVRALCKIAVLIDIYDGTLSPWIATKEAFQIDIGKQFPFSHPLDNDWNNWVTKIVPRAIRLSRLEPEPYCYFESLEEVEGIDAIPEDISRVLGDTAIG